MTKQIMDIDAELGTVDEPVHTREVRLFQREWTIRCDLNSYTLSALGNGDPGTIVAFIDNVLVEEQRAEFRAAIVKQVNLSPERLGTILAKLIEAAADRPTKQPSASTRGAVKKTSPRKSAASSSSRPVAR